MSSTQFWTGMLVPPLIKWANPYLKKFFKLNEFDNQTKERVISKQYPPFYSFLYNLWQISLIGSPVVFFTLTLIYLPQLFPHKQVGTLIFAGLLNFFGSIFIIGAILDIILWNISSDDFRDYVRYRQLKVGWGFEIKQQIVTLFKIGIIYYIAAFPVILYLLMR